MAFSRSGFLLEAESGERRTEEKNERLDFLVSEVHELRGRLQTPEGSSGERCRTGLTGQDVLLGKW